VTGNVSFSCANYFPLLDRNHPGLTEERVVPLFLHGDEGSGPKKLPAVKLIYGVAVEVKQ